MAVRAKRKKVVREVRGEPEPRLRSVWEGQKVRVQKRRIGNRG